VKQNKGTWAAVAALLPALMIAAIGWMEAQAQKDKKLALADNYGEFVVDRMERDEALERALYNCMALLPARASLPAEAPPALEAEDEFADFESLEPSVDLDEIAEEFGYEQETAP